jgi:hypothetical protein
VVRLHTERTRTQRGERYRRLRDRRIVDLNHPERAAHRCGRIGAPISRALSVCLAYGCPHPSPAARLARSWTRMNRTVPIGRSSCGANPVSAGQRRRRKAACRQFRPACARERSPSPHNRRRCRGRPRDAPLGIPPNLCGTAIPWPSRLPSGYAHTNPRTPARASGSNRLPALGGSLATTTARSTTVPFWRTSR